MLPPAVHRAIVCVDVERFTDQRRTNPDQGVVRAGLYHALAEAFARSGIPWGDWYREDRGDGVLVLVPPQIPKCLLVERFPRELAAALRKHNQSCGAQARIRLRLAVHAGEVHHDQHGVVGVAINLAFRLLEAATLKTALAASSGVVALIASPWFFEEVIRHAPASDPSAYRQIPVAVKDTQTLAWVCLPDQPNPPAWPAQDVTPKPPLPASEEGMSMPRQLPAAVGNFVGRSEELQTLTRLLNEAPGQGMAVVISAITGTAGVGKTALAVHWAHQIADRFPDGSLFANLRGHDLSPPVPPEQALDRMLRALGVPAEKIPAEVETQAALYRSLLDGRRVLVVLDNAATAEQVRPLLPGTPGCMAVVTSRSSLPGLVARDGAHPISLDRLTPIEAITLLRQIIGTRKVDAEPAAAAELARRCAYLPLALRIAGQRATTHRHSALANVSGELAERRLDVLDAADDYTAVRTVFSWSYRALPDEPALVFRLLGLHPGPDISIEAAAALVGTSFAHTRLLLEVLTGAHLMEEHAQGRYRLHDLLRLYATERAYQEETPQDRAQAVRRTLGWYLHIADAARKLLNPHPTLTLAVAEVAHAPPVFTTPGQALHWFDAEYLNLISATRQAAEAGHHDIAWRLPAALWFFFLLRKHRTQWMATNQTALTSVRHLGDRIGNAWILRSLGACYHDLRRLPESIEHNQQALAIFCSIGDQAGQATTLNGLGASQLGLRHFKEAIEHFQQALTIHRKIADRAGEGWSLTGLGYAHIGVRRFTKSVGYFRQAVTHTPKTDKQGTAWALHGLACAHRGLHHYEEAINHDQQALAIFRQIGDWWGQGETLYHLGNTQHDLGRSQAARLSWTKALNIFEELHAPRAAQIRARMPEQLLHSDSA